MVATATTQVVYSRPESLTDFPNHYCPGCTHGVAHRLVAEVMDEMDEQKPSGPGPVSADPQVDWNLARAIAPVDRVPARPAQAKLNSDYRFLGKANHSAGRAALPREAPRLLLGCRMPGCPFSYRHWS